ncbi:MAG: hypothetical protein KJ674_01585 [Nanoarchaeota archaeon]|nr:hypothetical protein [Nanoarchaeota archaeon]
MIKTNCFKTYAFEGLNASGKSSVANLLSKELSQKEYRVGLHKISGLGKGQRMDKLREILNHRETLLRENKLNEHQERDFLSDRIFRIATRQQIRDYKNSNPSNYLDISLLDRTPLMSWAYSSSINVVNPYLDEILEESLNLTKELSIDLAFLFDVDPITVYTRIICRNCKKDENVEEQVLELSKLIKAPKEVINKVVELSIFSFKNNPNIEPKPFHIWDYMSYDEVCNQMENYHKVMEIAREKIGLKSVIIDATKNIENVIETILIYLPK